VKIFLLLAVMVGSAFAQKIQIESDNDANFGKYKTFAIRDGELRSKEPSLNSDLVRKQIDESIKKYMQQKGLTFVAEGRADLNVRYTLGTPRKVEMEAYPTGWRGWGTKIVKVPYTEGTLVIDLRDPTTKSRVWRAIARDEQSDPSKIQPKLDKMVEKAFEKYPPKEKG
jgi:hypothetical protein